MGKKANKFTVFAAFLIIISIITSSSLSANAETDDADDLPSGKIIQVDASQDNTVILMEAGSVWSWGDNSSRQLGEGVEAVQKQVFRPVKVMGLEKIKKIAVGNGYILALDEVGQVWGVGNNISNVISTAVKDIDMVSKPTKIEGLNSILNIAAGTNYAAAVKSDGTIWLWGQYRYKVESVIKAVEAKHIADVQKIFALRYNTIAIDKYGTGWICRGKQLEPKQITQVTGIIDIIEGVNSVYAVRDDGSVWSWDMSSSGAEKIEGLTNIKSIAV